MITRILIIEMAPFEVNVMKDELEKAGLPYFAEFIDFTPDWNIAFDRFQPQVVIVAYELLATVSIINFDWKKIASEIPVLCYAGPIGEENAIQLIKAGITDIVFKDNMSAVASKIQTALQHFDDNVADSSTAVSGLPLSYGLEMASNAILENCMEGILITIPDGRILSANPAACNMFGLTEAELIENGKSGIVDTTDPNLEILLAERRNKGKARGELRMVRSDGTIFPAILSSVVFTERTGQKKTVIIIRDVSSARDSERQLIKTQNELIESFRRLNKTLEVSQDVILSLDKEDRFVSVNVACEAIWGFSPEELIGTVYLNLVLPEDQDITDQTEHGIKNGNPVHLFENRYVHKSGRIVYMLWSAIWDEEEQLVYATGRDITDTKKLQKVCEVEQKRFMDLYNLAPCCLGILKGPEHIYEMANPLYLELVDRTPDIIGKTVREALPELEGQGIYELLDDVYRTGGSFVANEKLVQLTRHGRLCDTYLNFMYLAHRDNEGQVDGTLFFAIDVTEQVVSRLKIEESAKLYQNLIMELPVAAYSCDAEGKIAIFNKAAVKLWGREPEIGKDMWCGSWKILSHDGTPIPHEQCPMAIALNEGRTVSGEEIIIEHENGKRRNILPHAVPYFNAHNEIAGAVNMLTDITETKRADLSLKQQNEELMKTNKELDRFVYSVSHDLRSPLTSIDGIASFIEDESREPETIVHIKMIKESINRLDGFIRKILSYSQNNRTTIEVEPIAINDKVERIIKSLKNMTAAKHIDFSIDIAEDCRFGSDRQRFSAIIENLISNAIKYHNPETQNKFIKVVGRVSEDALHFSVTDNGIGIAPEYHDKIFDMFFRISGKSEGSGIGLYIVKDMVERLGGTIKVDSQKGEITTFNLVLKNFLLCHN